jgi:hypothetical protein
MRAWPRRPRGADRRAGWTCYRTLFQQALTHLGRESALEQRGSTAFLDAKSGGGGMLSEGAGEAAESAAAAGRAWPAFQPADGGHTHSGPGGQFLL